MNWLNPFSWFGGAQKQGGLSDGGVQPGDTGRGTKGALAATGHPWPGPSAAHDTETEYELTREQVRSSPPGIRMPAFLPYYDDQTGITAKIQKAYRPMWADSNVKAAVLNVIMSVMSLELQIHPADKKKERDRDIGEFVKWTLTERLSGGMDELVWNVLAHGLTDGTGVSEKIYAPEDRGKYAGKDGLCELKPKMLGDDLVPITDEFRNIVAFLGLRYNPGTIFDPRKFVIYRHLPLFGSPIGTSEFRAAYRPWWILNTAEALRASGLERRALPLLVGHWTNASEQPAVQAALKKGMSQNWIDAPMDAKIEAINIAGQADAMFASAVRDHKEDIFLAIQGATLQALTGDKGEERGDSKVHKKTSELRPMYLARRIEQVLNDREHGLITDIVDLNYVTAEYPRATVSAVNPQELKTELENAAVLRKEFSLPLRKDRLYELGGQEPPDPEDAENILKPPPPPGPPGGGMAGPPPQPLGGGGNGVPHGSQYIGRRGGHGRIDPVTGKVVYKHAEERERFSEDHWAEAGAIHCFAESAHQIGDVWKGPSGRYFTRRTDGRTVPARDPNKEAPAKKEPKQKPPAVAPAPKKPAAKAKSSAAPKTTPEQTAAAIKAARDSGTATPADLAALMAHHKVDELKELQQHLGGIKVGSKALKADRVQAIVDGAMALAKEKKAAPARPPAPAIDLKDPQALADAVHEAGAKLPDLLGGHTNTGDLPDWKAHKPLIGEVYDALKDRLGGASIDDFKKSLIRAGQAGTLELARNDLTQAAIKRQGGHQGDVDPARLANLQRSEVKHPLGGGTFHTVNTNSPVARKATPPASAPAPQGTPPAPQPAAAPQVEPPSKSTMSREELRRLGNKWGPGTPGVDTAGAARIGMLADQLSEGRPIDATAFKQGTLALKPGTDPERAREAESVLRTAWQQAGPEARRELERHYGPGGLAKLPPQLADLITQPKQPAAPQVEPQHVAAAVKSLDKDGNNLVPIGQVRQHLADKGVTDRAAQDRALLAARQSGHVTMSGKDKRLTDDEMRDALHDPQSGEKHHFVGVRGEATPAPTPVAAPKATPKFDRGPGPNLQLEAGAKPEAQFSDPAQGVVNFQNPRSLDMQTLIDPVHAQRMAKELGPSVLRAIRDHADEDGVADTPKVVDAVRKLVPGATDGDVLHALAHMGQDSGSGIELKIINEVRDLSDEARRKIPHLGTKYRPDVTRAYGFVALHRGGQQPGASAAPAPAPPPRPAAAPAVKPAASTAPGAGRHPHAARLESLPVGSDSGPMLADDRHQVYRTAKGQYVLRDDRTDREIARGSADDVAGHMDRLGLTFKKR